MLERFIWLCKCFIIFNPLLEARRGRVCASSSILSLCRGGEERDFRDAHTPTVMLGFFFPSFFALMQLFATPLLLWEISLNVSLFERWIIQGNATWWWSIKTISGGVTWRLLCNKHRTEWQIRGRKNKYFALADAQHEQGGSQKFSCCQVYLGLKPTWPK